MQIPGYEWDDVRKRYFKVLKTGELPGSAYTVSALATKERAKNRRNAALRSAEIQPPSPDPISVFDTKKLNARRGTRAIYTGRPGEFVTAFHYCPRSHELLVGSRGGVIAYPNFRTMRGASIVAVKAMMQGTPIVAAVDDTGSRVAVSGDGIGTADEAPSSSVKLLDRFVTAVDSVESQVLVGTQRGCSVWTPTAGNVLELPTPAVGAAAYISDSGSGSTALIGTQCGRLLTVDLRASSLGQIADHGRAVRSVTHVGFARSSNEVVVTSLSDEMFLFDLRNLKRPVLQYAGYENWSTRAHGFTLNPQKTAVCVAQEDAVCKIWDVRSGTHLRTLGSPSKRSGVPALQWEAEGLMMAHANEVRAVNRVRVAAGADGERVARLYHSLNPDGDGDGDANAAEIIRI